jgi:hypothetical protein
MTARSALSYAPSVGRSVFARFQLVGVYQM